MTSRERNEENKKYIVSFNLLYRRRPPKEESRREDISEKRSKGLTVFLKKRDPRPKIRQRPQSPDEGHLKKEAGQKTAGRFPFRKEPRAKTRQWVLSPYEVHLKKKSGQKTVGCFPFGKEPRPKSGQRSQR